MGIDGSRDLDRVGGSTTDSGAREAEIDSPLRREKKYDEGERDRVTFRPAPAPCDAGKEVARVNDRGARSPGPKGSVAESPGVIGESAVGLITCSVSRMNGESSTRGGRAGGDVRPVLPNSGCARGLGLEPGRRMQLRRCAYSLSCDILARRTARVVMLKGWG